MHDSVKIMRTSQILVVLFHTTFIIVYIIQKKRAKVKDSIKKITERNKNSYFSTNFPKIRTRFFAYNELINIYNVRGTPMNYLKKTCILRQIKQGFSGDGKTLSGLIKIEQYGKNLSAEVSIINFAPLSAGEYYCLLADPFGHTELLPLRGKSLFNIISRLDISLGFCGIICFVKNEVLPIAYGVNGDKTYDWRQILSSTFPSPHKTKGAGTSSPSENTGAALADAAEEIEEIPEQNTVDTAKINEIDEPTKTAKTNKYDDEKVAIGNYYRAEENDECEFHQESGGNAQAESGIENENGQTGQDLEEDGDAESILHPFKTDADGYYHSVKAEIDELFARYPKDESLNGVFSCSEWVRVKGEEGAPEYLVGVVYEDWKAKYICYALPAEDGETPPDEIKDVCTFVPLSLFSDTAGFFVIFQSAASGECIRPESV